MHPLMNADHIVIMTGNPEDKDGVRTLFTLKRDPDPSPFFLLVPLEEECPRATIVPNGRGWRLRPANDATEHVTERVGDDLLTLAAEWVTDRYGLPRPGGLLSGS
ncbi:hypothetical protein [Nonomuraea sp. NPDC049709]|uniref:hypothetical protein n=1 Tax=Nonomuraea sp. NPDC049709 TaxID=3154736 RepID=UPI0034418FB0